MGAICFHLLNDYSSSRQCTGTAQMPKKFALGFQTRLRPSENLKRKALGLKISTRTQNSYRPLRK